MKEELYLKVILHLPLTYAIHRRRRRRRCRRRRSRVASDSLKIKRGQLYIMASHYRLFQ